MGVITPQMNGKPANEHTRTQLRYSKDDFDFTILNLIALGIFAIVITGWIIMNFMYLQRGSIIHSITQDEFFINITNINNQTIAALPIIRQSDIGLIIWLVLSGTAIFLLLVKTLNYLPKFWAVIGLIVEAVTIVLSLLYIFFSIYAYFFLPNSPFECNLKLVIIIICRLAFLPACTRKLDPVVESLRKLSNDVFSFPSMFLFGLFIAILILIVTAFTALSFYSTDGIVSGIISLLGGIYLVSVITDFAIEVINECVTILNNSQNKEAKSEWPIFKSIGVVVRRESGLIIIWCTIILPVFLALFLACAKKYAPHPQSHLKTNYVKSWMISNGLEHALPRIASHPAGVQEATKKIFKLICSRSFGISTTFGLVFGDVLFVFSAMGIIISVGVPYAFFQNNLECTKAFIQLAVIFQGIGAVLLFGVVYATIFVASTATVNIILKDVIESVIQEMPLEDQTSKKCVIDQPQEPHAITEV